MDESAPQEFSARLAAALEPSGHSNDPIDLMIQAVQDAGQHPLKITATVRLFDEDGVPSGYLAGPALLQSLSKLYEMVIGTIHAERMRRLDQIKDWTLSPELLDRIVDALVEPIIEGFYTPHARVVQFCYAGAQKTDIPIPRELWWSTPVVQRLRRANDLSGHPHFSTAIHVSVQTLERFCAQLVQREHLPFVDSDPQRQASGYRKSMFHGIRAIFDLILKQD